MTSFEERIYFPLNLLHSEIIMLDDRKMICMHVIIMPKRVGK